MEKFTKIGDNKKEYDPIQLEKGIKIEKEHGDLYNFIEDYLSSYNMEMPLTEVEFCEIIAKAHLRELPDYYSRLENIENKK